MSHQFVMYRDVPAVCQDKQGREYWGDVPVARLNEITGKFEAVDNPRRMGYACRTRMKYRKRKDRHGHTPRETDV